MDMSVPEDSKCAKCCLHCEEKETCKCRFAGNIEGQNIIKSIEEWFNRHFDETRTLVIVGSIIAAQAYPGKVFGLTPVPGYERVAPAEKRMSSDKFVTFA